jgi:RHS repeat-associated protein
LYEAFMQRGPDAGGLGFWTIIASGGSANRQNVLNAFAPCGPARELAGTLYREEFWQVNDRLGTPRMIVDKSGSLASVSRHDYLPFGEELYAGTGGRTTGQGYMSDSTRQKFTGQQRDDETGLDYFIHRSYSSTQGRFTTPDPFGGSGFVSVPQSWNKYAYCLNRPFVFTDPSGLIWLTNDDKTYIWVKDDEYKKNKEDHKGYSAANGAVTQFQSGSDCPQCSGLNKGDWVQLNANGGIDRVA